MSPELLPPTLVTLSSCLGDHAFEFWWNTENLDDAGTFGVLEARYPELIEWYRGQFERNLGAPNVAFSRAVVDEFVTRFVGDPSSLVVLGCGLSSEHAAMLDVHQTPRDRGEYGVFEMLQRNLPLEPGGRVLGFEPLSYEYGLEHTWLCSSLEQEVHAELGVSPDPETGFLRSYEDGVRVADYINRDDVGAEPGTWLPWLVVEYPIAT